MSLWRHRTTIERAVAGQLAAEDDAKLRAHLKGCHECRRHYDLLSVQARILEGDPHSTAAASERELARLLGGIDGLPTPVVRRRWLPLAVGACGLALVAVFVWRGSPTVPGEEITMRGGEPSAGRFGIWLVTAPQDGGELRRDVAFPGPAGTVRRDEWVAFAVSESPSPVAYFRAVLVNEKGETMVLGSGRSVALDPGRWRAFGVASEDARGFEEPALVAAALAAGVEGNRLELPGRVGFQASGVFSVLP